MGSALLTQTPPLTKVERRTLGRFDTPRPLAQALCDCVIQTSTDIVLEPSCGGGVFVQSALLRLAELGALNPAKNVWACDIDSHALSHTGRLVAPHSPNFVGGNFLSLLPSAFNTGFNVIVGNPPFVRLHTLDRTSREIARKSLSTNQKLDAKASLWAYFPIHAFKLLVPGGRMAWIVPESVLHSEYGKQVLSWAVERFERCVAVSVRERCFISEGAKERIVMLILEGSGISSQSGIELIEYATAADAIAALAHLSKPDREKLPQLNGHAVPHLISPSASTVAGAMETAQDLRALGDFIDLKIGVVTGDNQFFVLEDVERKRAQLRLHHFLPIIGKFCELGDSFAMKKRKGDFVGKWLLCPSPRSKDKALLAHLRAYPDQKLKANRTMAKREHWYAPLLGKRPHAFFRYMGMEAPRMVLNTGRYYCTNTLHCVYFHRGLTLEARRSICLSVHSSYSQLSAEFEGRQYGSGVLKLEPSEGRRVRFAFSPRLVSAFAKAWEELVDKADRDGWRKVSNFVDEIITENCPDLARALPIEGVQTLLRQVRNRRVGYDRAVGV